ncbi:MAG: hypothetical protein A3B90_03225, partial [Candidatus Magasanikbacteria bacterium RIFCSPHIGHO2_02_FULL_41_13]
MPYDANKNELEIFKFWKEHNTFQKSIDLRPADKPYAFYDGPPFATGLPHYGHLVASAMKDVVPRFWTMNGYRVERRWGWDCHGLPVENIIEKELGFAGRKDIVEFGVGKFNEACRATVLKYAEEWKTVVDRMGRWVDMENDYKTMDTNFMESVWWVFSELWKKDLIYEGHKAMHVCPRCSTPLSNFEVTQGYKDVKDISVTAKFKLKNAEKFGLDAPVSILAWTTTPWTLPGNVLLAVGADIDYVLVKFENEYFVVARDLVGSVFEEKQYEVVSEVKGSEFVGLEYEPLFPYFASIANAFRVVAADFVTTNDGTGVVHIAPAFGEDDYNVGQRENVPLLQHVKMDGTFVDEVVDFAGLEAKPKDDPTRTDVEVIKWLAGVGKLFSKKKFEHSYPHCWRCDTPLLNYATSCWFVKVTHMKDELLANNEKTNWIPDHVKDGRFGKWLEGARDWAISRNRFWGTPLPVWRCNDEKCGNIKVFASVESLEAASGQSVKDLHKHIVDEITFSCEKCAAPMHRISEVLDCWFESGSMPYGQMHYPFENKEKFEATFPAQFIAEGQDQTRGWFYTLHVLATALTRGENPSIPVAATPAFQNVIVNGIVLAEDGKKMSKKLQNYPDPTLMLEKYGADAVRFYLVSSPVMHAENLNFSEAGVREVFNKLVNTLWNCFEFYKMFAAEQTNFETTKSKSILDQWILAKLQMLVQEVTLNMKKYQLAEASRPIVEFVTELSQWYVRRSRDRFKGDDDADKQQALATLREVFMTLSKVMAPFTPFIAEQIYQELTIENEEVHSVHLEMWSEAQTELLNEKVLAEMETVRKLVEMGLSLRSDAKVKVRQVLGSFVVSGIELSAECKNIIAEELNVKEVVGASSEEGEWLEKLDGNLKVSLNIEVSEALKQEGYIREIVRSVNQIRKEQGLTLQDTVLLEYSTESEVLRQVFAEFEGQIKKSVLATTLQEGSGDTELS